MYMNWATLGPSLQNVELHDEHSPNVPVNKPMDEVNADGREPKPYKLAERPRKFNVDVILRHIGEGYNVRYVQHW